MPILSIINNLLAILITIFVLIAVHEYGHFIFARLFKVNVTHYSIGFGKALWQHQTRTGMQVRVGMFPIGGYVKMLDARERPVATADLPYEFTHKPIWQRFLIILAGPLFNIIFAVLAFWFIYMVGIKTVPPVIGHTIPQSFAARAELPAHAEITQIANTTTPDWQRVLMTLLMQIGDHRNVNVQVRHQDQLQNYALDLQGWQFNPMQPQLLKSLGIIPFMPKIPPIVGELVKDSPAAHAGLQKQDRILKINDTEITSWNQLLKLLRSNPALPLRATIKRAQQIISLTINPEIKKHVSGQRYLFLGIKPLHNKWPISLLREIQYPPFKALAVATADSAYILKFNLIMLGKLLTGKISLQSLGGPISIIEGAGLSLHNSVLMFIKFLAIISLAIAFINLLPIPGLDGGHLVYLIIEKIRGKPISIAVQIVGLRIGLILLFILLVQASVNDITRLLVS